MNRFKYFDELLATISFLFITTYFIFGDINEIFMYLLNEHDYYELNILFLLVLSFSFITAFYAFKKYLDLKISNKNLFFSHTKDKLTGLKNREAFLLSLEEKKDVNVVLLNIIDFKAINKIFGYKDADLFLTLISKKLEEIVYKEACASLYRINGDEFSFLCKKNINVDEICQKIKHSFEEKTIFFNDSSFHLSLNISYSCNEPRFLTATIAMQECKKSLDKYIVSYENITYNSDDNKNSLEMLNVLKDAISDNRIIPVYHSIINNKTKKIYKYETLARIRKRDNELLAPFHFIELSKKFKLYHEITKSIIKKSFQDFKNKDVNFSVNFSYIDIHNPKILEYFYDILENNKETAKRLTIEILETENIDSYEELFNFRNKIKTYGCKLAIDDFGSGYSNWINILKLKPDYIKLDGSLIKDLLLNEDNRTLVQTIVLFAQKNNIKTIAEFVSCEALANLVLELGIDFSQGFHYSMPEELINIS